MSMTLSDWMLKYLIFNWSWRGRLPTWFFQILIGNIWLSQIIRTQKKSIHSQYNIQSFCFLTFWISSDHLMTFRYHILCFFWEQTWTKVEQRPDNLIYFSIFDHSLLYIINWKRCMMYKVVRSDGKRFLNNFDHIEYYVVECCSINICYLVFKRRSLGFKVLCNNWREENSHEIREQSSK